MINECAGEAYEPVGRREEKDRKKRTLLEESMDTIMNSSLESLKAQNEALKEE